MNINGIARIVYGVGDLRPATRFFHDLGLVAEPEGDGRVVFPLAEGSGVELRRADDPALPAPFLGGDGPRELVWGVPTPEDLVAVRDELARDREVAESADGVLHTRDDAGIAIGFQVYRRTEPVVVGSPENAPSDVRRFNARRQWYDRARPKIIFHAVFGSPDAVAGIDFYRERLGFRVTDVLRDKGAFLRAPGRSEHHNLFLFRAPRTLFSHLSFAVESIDELMAGANHMRRSGWSDTSRIGRHRASSMIFNYTPCPAGGRVEYSADGDYVDDDWQPSVWSERFAHVYWDSELPADDRAPEPDIVPLDGPVSAYLGEGR